MKNVFKLYKKDYFSQIINKKHNSIFKEKILQTKKPLNKFSGLIA